MPDSPWSADDLREFAAEAADFHILDDEWTARRERFLVEFERVAGPVRQRLLAKTGALTSTRGLARLAMNRLEEGSGPEHAWLLVTDDPWAYLAECVGDRAIAAYDATHEEPDAATLDGIRESSTRRALEA